MRHPYPFHTYGTGRAPARANSSRPRTPTRPGLLARLFRRA